jgi:MFS family permease
MRKILGVVLGAIAAMLVVAAFDALANHLYPMPELESDDPAALAAVVGSMPIAAKLVVTAGWLAGPLAGAWLALRVGDWRMAGRIVTAVVLAGSIANVLLLPHPLWMQVCAVLLPVVGGAIGMWLHRKPYPGEPLLG